MTRHRGLFVAVDGPAGTGKTTVTRALAERLTCDGYAVHSTTQPSRAQLGEIARHGTDTYRGYELACLVAADRYHQLRTEIQPHRAAGRIVLCDRYVASSYVLQSMDDVPPAFIHHLNDAADPPDLTIILAADPAVAAARVRRRGAHSRFHTDIISSRTEAALYRDAATYLKTQGQALLALDTTHTSTDQLVQIITRKLTPLARLPRPEQATA
ncbi:thymidylate kinase [Amycolatopsis deserti]|uniref:Thymidylate kinase n=1 Tax=Amycolatopsis deserti TaxID=185696 RepID=A0ABQ3IE14_9PSEU|nr:dTMP kinase [Amycolatopsis deserti]GHE81022.1 thymidylate kinase [Amycolatopsis deserti]